MSALIEFDEVCKYYQMGDTTVKAADHITMKIEKGEFVAIVGQSGSGKSTLLNILSGLERPDGGNVLYGDEDITTLSDSALTRFRRDNIGFVFQQYYLLSGMTVEKNVRMGADLASNSEYIDIIKAVGLGEKLEKYPSQLSGGEQQRVAIARALVNEPSMLLADEPTGNLDNNNAWEIMKLLEEINEKGTTVIVVTHNLEIVKVMKKRVITIKKGLVVSDSKDGDSDED